jgi:DNA-binding NtrC family response regulator
MSLNPEPKSPSSSDPHSPATVPRTLLLVDDEKVLREIIAKVLRREGYLVLEAATSDAAILAASQSDRQPALLISDITLPGAAGGMQLFAELRKLNPELKAVFISGRSLEEIIQDTPLPKGTAFMEKPFEHDDFVRTIREILR